jgi:RNA polymerase sigma factor (sigma-70 family)
MKVLPSLATRTTLLNRVKNPDDSDSWQTFFDLYATLIRGQARRAGLTADEIEEVTQETLIELSQRIQNFEYNREKGSFKGWLYNLTRWRIANQFKKRQRQLVSLELLDDAADGAEPFSTPNSLRIEPDEIWKSDFRRVVFDAALKNLRRALSPKQFQILDLSIVKQWPITQIAETLHTNRAHIYVLKLRVVSALKNEIRRLDKQAI